MKRVPVLLSLILTYLLFDTSTLEAAQDPRATQLTYQAWTKICINGSLCFVGAEARGACAPSGGSVVFHTVSGKAARLSGGVGTKLTLEGDIRVQVDQAAPIFISASKCYASGCYGEVGIDDDLVERLKRSNIITIEATTTAHRQISLSFPLADFAQAYEGPGPEPKVFEEIVSSEKMKEREQQEKEQKKARECKE
jgi:invasion protein IalB